MRNLDETAGHIEDATNRLCSKQKNGPNGLFSRTNRIL